MTKFFVDQSDKFKVFFLVERNNGKPLVFAKIEDYQNFFKISKTTEVDLHWYEFQNWTWGIDNWIREASTELDPLTGIRKFNAAAWRENKFKYLLLDWSLTDGSGAKVQLNREEISGRPQLSAASLSRVFSVSQSINTVALAFADRILIEGEPSSILLNEQDYLTLQKGEFPERVAQEKAKEPPKN